MSRPSASSGCHDFAARLTPDGQWMHLLAPRPAVEGSPRPALFLDRDGVMIEERHYLRDPAAVALIPGCTATVRAARAAGLLVVIVTNQSGIGRGLFGWADYAAVEARLIALLAGEGAHVDAILACPDDAHAAPRSSASCSWRKPSPGMVLAAAEALHIDLAGSLVVGDKASDLAAGRAAGLRLGVHVATGHGDGAERGKALALASPSFAVLGLASIADVAGLAVLAQRHAGS